MNAKYYPLYIHAPTVSEGLFNGLQALCHNGIPSESRNGPVIAAGAPVLIEYPNPANRVLFCPQRDANPFFHYMEALWMLAGREDVALPASYASNIRNYSDDGKTLWGAYGYRWRHAFGYDQLRTIACELKLNPDSRRCVLSMWSPATDDTRPFNVGSMNHDLYVAGNGGKDVPCNTQAYFRIVEGRLDMTVTNRSNDILWGAFGANAVHFSVLLEYMAARVGVPMGRYFQFTNNLHLYTAVATPEYVQRLANSLPSNDYAQRGVVANELFPYGTDDELFDKALVCWLDGQTEMGDVTGYFAIDKIAEPMRQAWAAFKRKDREAALQFARSIVADDWRVACVEWLERRYAKKDSV